MPVNHHLWHTKIFKHEKYVSTCGTHGRKVQTRHWRTAMPNNNFILSTVASLIRRRFWLCFSCWRCDVCSLTALPCACTFSVAPILKLPRSIGASTFWTRQRTANASRIRNVWFSNINENAVDSPSHDLVALNKYLLRCPCAAMHIFIHSPPQCSSLPVRSLLALVVSMELKWL